MKLVPITGQVLAWSIDESGYSIGEVAAKVQVERRLIEDWIAEASRPNITQFNRLVELLKRPSAAFFLPEPPPTLLPPQFRRASGPGSKLVTPDERTQIRWALQLQDLVDSVLMETGASAVSLPALNEGESTQSAAEHARSFVGVTVSDQLQFKSANAAFNAWRVALESRGLLSLSLPLGEEGVRGFSSWNDRAPMLAVNTAYNFEARIYTMIHELAHLLSRNGASCWGFLGPGTTGDLGSERWCDQFAADFLLPELSVRDFVMESRTSAFATFAGASLLAKRFRVSIRAAALRLIHLGFAPRSLYGAVDSQLRTVDFKAKDSFALGRSRAARRMAEVGRRGVTVLLDGIASGSLGGHHAAEVLHVHPAELGELSRKVLAAAV